jgi:hypothetical protein
MIQGGYAQTTIHRRSVAFSDTPEGPMTTPRMATVSLLAVLLLVVVVIPAAA